MTKKKLLRRNELLVYIIIACLSLLLVAFAPQIESILVSLLPKDIKFIERAMGMILNLSSELLGVALVFFIVSRMFPTSEERREK